MGGPWGPWGAWGAWLAALAVLAALAALAAALALVALRRGVLVLAAGVVPQRQPAVRSPGSYVSPSPGAASPSAGLLGPAASSESRERLSPWSKSLSLSASPLEKDKSHKRKSNLNRAHTEEAADSEGSARRRSRAAAAAAASSNMAVDSLSPSPAVPLLVAAAPTAAASGSSTPSPRRPGSSAMVASAAPSTPPLGQDGGLGGLDGGVTLNGGLSQLSPYRLRSPFIRRVSPIRVTPLVPSNRMSLQSPATSTDVSMSPARTPSIGAASASDTSGPSPGVSPAGGVQGSPGLFASASASAAGAFSVHPSASAAAAENRLALASTRLVQLASRPNGGQDATESDVSQSVDRLTALAKETLARVDRITAESSAALQQTTPSSSVGKNVVIVSKADQDAATTTSIVSRPVNNEPKPVSILKRKTSHDEGSISPPVTFSPSVLDVTSRRHGILKKSGGSLDESHFRRSSSPETELSGSILKNRPQRRSSQRRSSLEDSANRQSILKRKETDDGHERHGILKKKVPSDQINKQPHISIADHVILAASGDLTMLLDDDVRPILKKKCSSEEQATVDPASFSYDVTPRPILKKKSSTDTDEMDEWPKKTILKTSRNNSREENGETSESFRRRSVGSVPLARPSGYRLSHCDDEDEVSRPGDLLQRRLRASKSFTSVRPSSPLNDFSAVGWRRRSWDYNSSIKENLSRAGGPLSVAERVSSMELAFHSNGASPKQPNVRLAHDKLQSSIRDLSSSSNSFSARSNSCQGRGVSVSPPRSPPPPSPCQSPVPTSPNRSASPSPSASPPPRFSPCFSPLRDSSKPNSLVLPAVTSPSSEEFRFSFKNHIASPIAHKDSWSLRKNGSLQDASMSQSSDHLGDNWILKNRSSSPVDHCANWIAYGSASLPIVANNELLEDNISKERGLGECSESENKISQEYSLESQLEEGALCTQESTQFKSLDSHKRSSIVEPFILAPVGTGRVNMEEEKRELQRSSSRVSEKALMFSQIEDRIKQSSEADQTSRIQKADLNKGIARYRNRKSERFGEPSRFSTQPITVNELEGAKPSIPIISSGSATNLRKEDDSEDENEPSKLSLAERVKLFNQVMTAERLPVMGMQAQPQSNRRRAPNSRFKTQPVTIEEVSTAQSIIKHPAKETIEVGSTQATKSIFESAVKNLSKSISCSRVPSCSIKDSPRESPKRGILKTNFIQAPSDEDLNSDRRQDNRSDTSPAPILFERHESGLDGIKKVLNTEKKVNQSTYDKTQSALKPVLRRSSFGNVDQSSSDSDTGSSSDSDDEGNFKTDHSHRDPLQTSDKAIQELEQTHSPSGTSSKQAMQSDAEEKVQNNRNTKQEKENRDIQNKLEQNFSSIISKVSSETILKVQVNKKSILRKLDVLNKNNEVAIKNSGGNKHSRSLSSSALTSDDGDTSSGGQEVRRIISNDAVARRHQANLARQNLVKEKDKQQKEKERPRPGRLDAGLTQRLGQQLQLRLPGQPSPLSKSRSQHAALQQDSDGDRDDEMAVQTGTAGSAGGLRRCLTQPMPVDEDVAVSANASIADRLKLLQQNGQTGWRKRIVKPVDEVAKSVSDSQQVLKQLVAGSRCSIATEPPPELVSLQGSGNGDRSSILADRLGKLENASQDWRKRVGQKDAEQFSVKGKMKLSSSVSDVPKELGTPPSTPVSPLPTTELPSNGERGKKTPKPRSFRSKSGVGAHSFKRSMSAPGAEEDTENSCTDQESPDTTEHPAVIEPYPQVQGPRIELPQIDDQFDKFFSTVGNIKNSQSVEIQDVDLDSAVTRSSEMLVRKRTVKITGRRVASRNPVKALSARTDLCTEYTELRTGVAERELTRLRTEKLAKNSTLAVEALAGLASKEDFSAVSLRKSASTSAVPSGSTLLPYRELMLLQIKGRRHVQTRLVEPVARSINSGDNFVLVTPSQVYNWVGRYSNVIERARGAEVALHVQQNKDLGFNGVAPVITISEDRSTSTSNQSATFWRLLGSLDGAKAQDAGHPDEDEIYETALLETNMVYELQGSELVPHEKCWGIIPRIEILDPSKILVLDFGSEMYVWNGKNAPLERRKIALQLAKELWEQGYDYTDCDICPLLSATSLGPHFGRREEAGLKCCKKRPSWSLLAKVTQHMETIMFREKFLDWPDFTRVIQTREDSSKDRVVDASVDVRPCDAKEMLDSDPEDPDLVLEGCHLGRGSEFYDEETRRFYEIQTMGVKMWHIQEYEYSALPESSYGQFHSGDNYVVRWAYRVTVTTRALNGQPSKHAASQGRDRFCYFCWQGRNALINDKGAAALLTVELDKERGPQICVNQGLEPPAFLGLFEGGMSVHSGRREDQDDHQDVCRLYAVKGEVEREACLVEVVPSMRQLRSRGSFILLNAKRRLLHVWHGIRSLPDYRKVAETLAKKLQKKAPSEFGISPDQLEIQNEEEGSESPEFFKGVGGSNRHLYVSLPHSDSLSQSSPRLFHLTSLPGTFTATEVAAPCRNRKMVLPFPFQQSHLYGASQPAIFLLDSGDFLWLWQGWWPSERDEEDSNAVGGGEGFGSGAVRWQAERRAAMQTALDYWTLRYPDKLPQTSLVWAGLEPLEFTNLFLEWSDRDDIAVINIEDGHKAGDLLSVEAELARLTQSTYPAAQLLQRPLPDGVDPTRLELYLAPNHFQELLGMSKEDFLDLPQWKQTKLKKDVGLF